MPSKTVYRPYIKYCDVCLEKYRDSVYGGKSVCYNCSNNLYPKEFRRKRLEVISRDAECKVCRQEYCEEDGRYFHVHHIDSDKVNNSLENLVLLCEQCHSAMSSIVGSSFDPKDYDYEIEYGMFGKRIRSVTKKIKGNL